MNYNISQLKNLVSKAKPNDIIVLTVNNFEKDSVSTTLKLIEKFIKKGQDYVVITIKKSK